MVQSEALKVLVVDQSLEFLEIAFQKLSGRGFNIMTAHSGEEAIGIIKQGCIEAIVLDFNKANKNGIQIINFINTLEKKPNLVSLFS